MALLELRQTNRIFEFDTSGADILYEIVLAGEPLSIPYYFDDKKKQYRSDCVHERYDVDALFTLPCSDFPDDLCMDIIYRTQELRPALSTITFTRKENIISLEIGLDLDEVTGKDFIWNVHMYIKAMRHEAKKAEYEVGKVKTYEDFPSSCHSTITFDFPVGRTINEKVNDALVIYDEFHKRTVQNLVKRALL